MATKAQHLADEILSRAWSALARSAFPQKRPRLDLVRNIRRHRRMLSTSMDAWIIASLASSCQNVCGDVAEAGCYRGATTSLIATVLPHKTVYALDAYEDGLPAPSEKEAGEYWAFKGNVSSSYADAVSYLSQWPNIKTIKGYFPQTAAQVSSSSFCFVHLDVDMYESTKRCLEWFYPRVSRGGLILTHDWDMCPGVSIAFEEFLRDKPENVIELPTNQAFFVKL